MSSEHAPGRRIVVGVDGSRSSAALAWAVRQDGLTGACVDAVIAWDDPAVIGAMPVAPLGEVESSNLGTYAESMLGHAVNQTVDPDGPVKVNSIVRRGYPAQVLLGAKARPWKTG